MLACASKYARVCAHTDTACTHQNCNAGRVHLTMNEVVEHFGGSIHRPCELRVLRRVGGAGDSPGSYALLSTQLTPSEFHPGPA